jgi:hypothetical protein
MKKTKRPAQPPRPLGQSCLHCQVWEVLRAHHVDLGLIGPDGDPVFDTVLVAASLAEVIGELFSGLDNESLKASVKHLNQIITMRIDECRKSDTAPEMVSDDQMPGVGKPLAGPATRH